MLFSIVLGKGAAAGLAAEAAPATPAGSTWLMPATAAPAPHSLTKSRRETSMDFFSFSMNAVGV
jgi:hypothetical protein